MGPSPTERLVAACIDEVMQDREPDFKVICKEEPGLIPEVQRAFHRALALLPAGIRSPHPKRLGSYIIESELARGGMGAVLLGRHETKKRRVAIKVLPRPYAFIDEHRERFRREALALARLEHRAILPIHEVGEDGGVHFVVLDYVEGGSLDTVLASLRGLDIAAARKRGETLLPGFGPYEMRVASLLAEVASALECAHVAGIVHRDVKPANILLDPKGRVFLADFGLALQEELTTLTHSKAIVGTRHYLAPELTDARGRACPLTDVYALGVTLFECLVLRPPFGGDTEEALLREIRDREPPRVRALNRHVPEQLEEVCLRALEKRPSRRHESAAAIAADLRRVITHEPGRRDPGRRLRRARGWMRYHRAGLRYAVLAVVVLTAVIAILTSVVGRRRAREWRQWKTDFKRGEYFLVTDAASDPADHREARLVVALEHYRSCVKLRPDMPQAWLRTADIALRLRHFETAAAALARAAAVSTPGWYHRQLAKALDLRRETSREPPLDAVERSEWQAWEPLDRLHLADTLYRAGNRLKAIEVVTDPGLTRSEILAPELLTGVIYHMECFFPSRGMKRAELRAYSESMARRALLAYDRFSEGTETSDLVAFNRALLIRDALAQGFDLDAERTALLDTAEAALRRNCRAERDSAHSLGHLLGVLWLRQRLPEAERTADRIGSEGYAELDGPARLALLKTWICRARYTEAFGVLSAIQRAETPFHDVVALHEDLAAKGTCAPDAAGLRTCMRELGERVTPADRKAAGVRIDRFSAGQGAVRDK